MGPHKLEQQVAAHIGHTLLAGWKACYDRDAIARGGGPTAEGIGTGEVLRQLGGHFITIEAGVHGDPSSEIVALRDIKTVMRYFGIMASGNNAPPKNTPIQVAVMNSIIRAKGSDDKLNDNLHTLMAVNEGQIIGKRGNNEDIVAPITGVVVFPKRPPLVAKGKELCYFATVTDFIKYTCG